MLLKPAWPCAIAWAKLFCYNLHRILGSGCPLIQKSCVFKVICHNDLFALTKKISISSIVFGYISSGFNMTEQLFSLFGIQSDVKEQY